MTNTAQHHDPPPASDDSTSRVAWLVGPAFVALAVWFLWIAPGTEIPVGGTPAFDPQGLAPTIRATVNTDPPTTRVGSYEYRCTDCHNLFKNDTEKSVGLVQHTNIVFNHGMNNRCFNCHDRLDRNKLVGRDGAYISYTDIPLLCSQCHGTTYRDWQKGMHGKTLGSWETGSPDQHRLACDQCHDPHAPAFPAYVPLPAPNTLRMGVQHAESQHHSPSPLAIPFESGHDTEADHTDDGGADH